MIIIILKQILSQMPRYISSIGLRRNVNDMREEVLK